MTHPIVALQSGFLAALLADAELAAALGGAAMAQEVTGTPGSPNATTTVDGQTTTYRSSPGHSQVIDSYVVSSDEEQSPKLEE